MPPLAVLVSEAIRVVNPNNQRFSGMAYYVDCVRNCQILATKSMYEVFRSLSFTVV